MERNTNGIVIGLVIDLKDKQNIGRVQVKYPHLEDQPSDWARIAAPMAGGKRGAFFRPEVGDEVLVAFEHGDPRRPYIIGALWSTADPPPDNIGDAAANDIRVIVSRSKHMIVLDDTPGKEKVIIVDKDNKRKVIIDSANSKIEVICDQGNVEVKAATGDVKVEAVNVSVKATAELKLEATGNVTIKGAMVNIN